MLTSYTSVIYDHEEERWITTGDDGMEYRTRVYGSKLDPINVLSALNTSLTLWLQYQEQQTMATATTTSVAFDEFEAPATETTTTEVETVEAIEAKADGLTVSADRLDVAKHDGIITLKSPKTGDHRTFRIRTVRGGGLDGKRLVEMLTGQNNTSNHDYKAFAFVMDDGRIAVWHRFRGVKERSQWERLADMLERPTFWAEKGVEYMASLHCRRCGRVLTHPESVADGLGPVCREKV